MALHPVLLSLVGTVFVLLLWHLVVISGLVNPLLLPSPLMVAAVFIDAEALQGLLHDALFTVYPAFSGFALGGVSGVAIGMIVGFFRPIYALLEFLIKFYRSLPAAALLPAFMLFLGIGDASKVALVAFSCSLVMLVQTAAGVKARNATRTMVAQISAPRSYRSSARSSFRRFSPRSRWHCG
jgi:NitT/TauT family transport system permease protein